MTGQPAVFGRPPWKERRFIIKSTLLFCATVVAYLAVVGQGENRLHETIVLGCFALAGSVIGAFIFGATWDDRNIMKLLGPKAYQDQVPEQLGGVGEVIPVPPDGELRSSVMPG